MKPSGTRLQRSKRKGKMANKILICDDEAPLRHALRDKLSREGYELEEASDGDEAIAKMKSFKPELLLLDFVMPKKDGVEVLHAMKEDEELKNIKVIMLTNLSDPIKSYEATDAGEGVLTSMDYLVKSDWKLEEVVDKIKSKLSE